MARIKNGLYQRGKSWYICIKINGQQIRKSFGPNRLAAQAALSELKKQCSVAKATQDWSGLNELLQPKVRLTFAEAAEKYLAERADLKQSTLRGYNEILKNYLLPSFGQKRLSDISEDDIATFQAAVAKKVSAVRTNNIMGLLRYILKSCARRKLLAENPALNVRTLKESPPDVDPFTPEELERVFSYMAPDHRNLFTCQAWTGARPNELLALRWKDVNFERNEIYIKHGRVRGHEGSPKTLASHRTIPIFSVVKNVLSELQRRPTQHVDGYVFLTRRGQRVRPVLHVLEN